MEHDKVLDDLTDEEELTLIARLAERLRHWRLRVTKKRYESVEAAAKDHGYTVHTGRKE
jgi:hypothetical protein